MCIYIYLVTYRMMRSMFRSISKRVQHRGFIASSNAYCYFFSTKSFKHNSDCSNSSESQSLTVSYLLNACGLSLESAISVSKKVQLETTEQPDCVLDLLKSSGLAQTHIRNLITSRPFILLADPDKTLKPNFDLFGSLGFSGSNLVNLLKKEPRILDSNAHKFVEFFKAYGFTENQISALTMKRPGLFIYNCQKNFKPKFEYFISLGLSGEDIAKMLSSEPYILERSLENWIMPSVQVLRRVLGTDDYVLKAIRRCYRILEYDLEKLLEANITHLMNHGVPKSKVLKLILLQPDTFLKRSYHFSEIVEEVNKLGFNPTRLTYGLAIRAIASMSKSRWEQKLGAFRSFGVSNDEVLSAFRLQPMCMLTSEEKIRKLMGFYVNELKLKPSVISKSPNLLLLSLEKRIIPRCSVLQLLMSKDIIDGNVRLLYTFRMTEKLFVEKYVRKYQDVVPEIIDAHQGKIQFQGLPIELKRCMS